MSNNCFADFETVQEIKIFKDTKYIIINGTKFFQRNVRKKVYCRQKATFDVYIRTENFKMIYVRVVLCMCIPSLHKFSSPESFPKVTSKWFDTS